MITVITLTLHVRESIKLAWCIRLRLWCLEAWERAEWIPDHGSSVHKERWEGRKSEAEKVWVRVSIQRDTARFLCCVLFRNVHLLHWCNAGYISRHFFWIRLKCTSWYINYKPTLSLSLCKYRITKTLQFNSNLPEKLSTLCMFLTQTHSCTRYLYASFQHL